MQVQLVVYKNKNEIHFEVDALIEIFLPATQIAFTDSIESFNELIMCGVSGVYLNTDETSVEMRLYIDKVLEERTLFVRSETDRHSIKRHLYHMLEKQYKPTSEWGILVGIRPVKIVHELLDQAYDEQQIKEILSEEYLVQPNKINLMIEVAKRERPHLYPNRKESVSLYICIPFCPTRCVYCSFPSNDMKLKGKLLPRYLELLLEEVSYAIAQVELANKEIDCIYIGGGTPTSLDASQLETLLQMIQSRLDLNRVKEYTVEAGRPDTITIEKLEIMKRYGVDRICINPQSFNNETLIQIGRKHDDQMIIEAFKAAREIGFRSINMDLIMGLPGETVDDARLTISKVIGFRPENVTIHTLAVKKASRLIESLEAYELAHDQTVSEMLAISDQELRTVGLTPYYMYRQKKMIGHLENVGYALDGFESLYNMRIMEEKHTIVACGAGAVSKICFPDENRFERVANFKGLEDYLDRFDEILLKKEAIINHK